MNDLSAPVQTIAEPDAANGPDPISIDVTIVIPVRDDDHNLRECLDTVGAFTEVIVVDSGHRASTEEITLSAGASYRAFKFEPPFPKKRNWLLDTHPPKNDWVLFLDADERITHHFLNELQDKLEQLKQDANPVSGFWLNYQNYFMGRALKYGLGQRKLALINRHAGRYERIDDPGWTSFDMEIHEHPVLKGRTGEIRALIDHRDFRSVSSAVEKHIEYARWEAGRVRQLRDTGGLHDHDGPVLSFRQRIKYRMITSAMFPAAYFLYVYLLRFGFIDGKAGLSYAMLKANYFATIYLLLKDHKKD